MRTLYGTSACHGRVGHRPGRSYLLGAGILRCRVRCKSAVEGAAALKTGPRPLVIATRGSKLALEQTRQVQQLLHAAAQLRGEVLQLSTVELKTTGDNSPTAPLRSLGAGAFADAVDDAVASGAADMGVHSLKDCPSTLPEGLLLAACLPRADPRDCLIAGDEGVRSLRDLVPGSRVGTSSSRRAAQIRHSFPHLQVVELRGNVDARLQRIRAREISATVLARAGIQRLGLEEEVGARVLSTDEMLPAACQGAVGVVCREGDAWVAEQLAAISHRPTRLEVAAERACLAALLGSEEAGRGGQAFPAIAWAAHTRYDPDAGLMGIDCFVSDLEGRDLIRYTEFARSVVDETDAESLGSLYGTLLRMAAAGNGWIPLDL
ncbi:hypothetical protein HYH03_013675 [Edaphochlamys debaryana]|uniref:hydroxymethylbilane synthase n=1 Tax=Edaphochlamys debaryana TaxID=47281 RepID=A0A836BSW2_9CHLO|nr:hypothetical protein HYH03_013675 [Edaphochlamys debaryana]|eukprot:KAG2487675.1 hypothetical protein HYH03_013675 [Edaphochlamys debaryana]